MPVSSVTSTLPDLGGSSVTANEAGSADRFLKLLVAQMQNQDPLSPMDNAQVTSQMAQISTVDGIAKLNASVQGLSGQFLQMQTLQSAALVGTDVVVPGDQLAVADGMGQGGFELNSPADQVTVEVLSAGGQVVDTLNLGASGSGAHGFNWESGAADASSGLRFRVTATRGGVSSQATALMRDHVNAVSLNGNTLTLELRRSGSVPYGDIKSFN